MKLFRSSLVTNFTEVHLTMRSVRWNSCCCWQVSPTIFKC